MLILQFSKIRSGGGHFSLAHTVDFQNFLPRKLSQQKEQLRKAPPPPDNLGLDFSEVQNAL